MSDNGVYSTWLNWDGAEVLLLHDEHMEGRSEIEITYPGGNATGYLVPYIDARGLPSDDGGAPPTLRDLERLAKLMHDNVFDWSALKKEREAMAKLASDAGVELSVDAPDFEWLQLIDDVKSGGADVSANLPVAANRASPPAP
jgi:hypothetical protein